MTVKEIFKFLKWNIVNFKQIFFLWGFGTSLIVLGMMFNGIMTLMGVIVLFSLLVSNDLRNYWKLYKSERNKLFDTIKKA